MKRSDALKIIDDTYSEFCSDWMKANLNDLEGFVPLNERILSTLEKAGMLPPLIEEQSFKMLPSGEMIYNVNEWEPECNLCNDTGEIGLGYGSEECECKK